MAEATAPSLLTLTGSLILHQHDPRGPPVHVRMVSVQNDAPLDGPLNGLNNLECLSNHKACFCLLFDTSVGQQMSLLHEIIFSMIITDLISALPVLRCLRAMKHITHHS